MENIQKLSTLGIKLYIIFSEDIFLYLSFFFVFILFLVRRQRGNSQGEMIHLQSRIDKIYLQRGNINYI